tara:strand:+ start:726 stop:911 length:186 start_codon:yes stop_codon:yes gene_type:complete
MGKKLEIESGAAHDDRELTPCADAFKDRESHFPILGGIKDLRGLRDSVEMVSHQKTVLLTG